MPFLLPPAEFKASDLNARDLAGTCELQICRSAGNWSMGLQHRTEHSIQNAYLKGARLVVDGHRPSLMSYKAIQMSEHFVYIENQFFITRYISAFFPESMSLTDLQHRCARCQDRKPNW